MAVGKLGFGGFSLDKTLTDEQLEERRRMAASMLKQGSQTGPVGSGWEGAARMAQALLGAYQMRKAETGDAANAQYNSGLMADLVSGNLPATATAAPAFPADVAAGGSPFALTAGQDAVDPAIIRAGLVKRGLPEHVADGFLMNFQDESGFNPGINEQNPTVPGSRGGFGLYQLTGPRRKEYEAFASQRGVQPADIDAQLDFLAYEMNGPEANAAKSILSAPDASTAAAEIARKFLRPAKEHLDARIKKYMSSGAPQVASAPAPAFDPSNIGVPYKPSPVGEALVTPPADYAKNIWGQAPNTGGPSDNISAQPVDPNATLMNAGAVRPYSGPGADASNYGTPPPSPNARPYNGPGAQTLPMPMTPTPPVVAPEAAVMPASAVPPGPPAALATPAAMQAPVQAPSVAQALAYPIQAQAGPNDPMVAGADQTLQPQPGSMPQRVPQAIGTEALVAAISDPRANPQTRQVALSLLGQRQEQAQLAQRQQIEAQQWRAREDYQQQQRRSDPLIQAQTRKAEVEARNAEANPRGEETFYGNPIAIERDGKLLYGQIGSKGTFKEIDLGGGATFAPPTKQIDTGTEILIHDQAGNVIASVPKQNQSAAAQTAAGTVEGKAEAERRLSAPQDAQTGYNALDILDQIEKHKDLDRSVGIGSYLSGIRGTPQFEFNNLVEQAKSGAFLAAIDQMRGLGALSNAEGGAATAAITRMTTSDTKEGFMSALADYRKIVKQGIERAERRMGSQQAPQGQAPAATPGTVRRKFNPQTGRVE